MVSYRFYYQEKNELLKHPICSSNNQLQGLQENKLAFSQKYLYTFVMNIT